MSAMSLGLIYPLFAMFLLSAVILMTMFRSRIRAVKSGQIKVSYFKTYESSNLPEDVIKTARHFSNLFEAPVLFYVICVVGMILNIDSQLFVVLAWGYVLVRAVHAYVHIGHNKLQIRMSVYALGWLIMIAMWALLLIKLTA
ncbi:MAG: MAPEG family protein [Bdellovibrionaceae bacterium]|nr:MAPEG family protein [Pseudobdellovibrionaceae bacterium]